MKPERISRVLTGIAAGSALLLAGLLSVLWLIRNGAFAPEARVVPVAVRFPAPAVQLTDLQGGAVDLQDYRGQVVLLNVWATWCVPCRSEMPALQEYSIRHAQSGFIVIAVNTGERAPEVTAFAEELGLTFPIWLDPTSVTTRSFHTPYLPGSYVIDREGVVRLSWVGPIDLSGLEEYVTPLILEQ